MPAGDAVRSPNVMHSQRSCVRLGTSLRGETPLEVLPRASAFASRLGVSRVTQITQLDRIGLPVFSAIRPNADHRSLCVNNGKGVTVDEARISACMEAIEFAVAECPRVTLKRLLVSWDELCAPIEQFSPCFGANIDRNHPIQAVEAENCRDSSRGLLPAELVYFPYPTDLPGARLFGTSTNGLSSGTDLADAQIHGLAEVIERDIQSFQLVCDTSQLVPNASLGGIPLQLSKMVDEAGLELWLRYVESEFRIPFFSAYIVERSGDLIAGISGGWGCHAIKEVAAVRAIAEAAQSRLTTIHGARDDLTEPLDLFSSGQLDVTYYRRRAFTKISNSLCAIAYESIRQANSRVDTLGDAWRVLVEALGNVGLSKIYRVILTDPTDPVTVLRVIVPGAESFDRTTKRVGPRLRRHIGRHAG